MAERRRRGSRPSRTRRADRPFRNSQSPERCDLNRGNPRNKKAQPNLFRPKSLPLGLAGRHQQAAVLDGCKSHRQDAPTNKFYSDHVFISPSAWILVDCHNRGQLEARLCQPSQKCGFRPAAGHRSASSGPGPNRRCRPPAPTKKPRTGGCGARLMEGRLCAARPRFLTFG